jgi:hypothetical protein
MKIVRRNGSRAGLGRQLWLDRTLFTVFATAPVSLLDSPAFPRSSTQFFMLS